MHSDQYEEKPTVETVNASTGKEQLDVRSDVVSDPARGDVAGIDWTDEGGATLEGPATAGDYEYGEPDTAGPRLSALLINCTLKRSDNPSSGDVLGGQVLEELCGYGVTVTRLRAVDFNISPGVEKDMGAGDEWPSIRKKVHDADILVLVTPTWLGQHSSVAQRVLERLNADSSEVDASGLPVFFGKVAIPVVVGNEDGTHHISGIFTQSLSDVGFSIAAKPSVYWNGEAMQKTDYRELANTPSAVSDALRMSAQSSVHLARILATSPYPA